MTVDDAQRDRLKDEVVLAAKLLADSQGEVQFAESLSCLEDAVRALREVEGEP